MTEFEYLSWDELQTMPQNSMELISSLLLHRIRFALGARGYTHWREIIPITLTTPKVCGRMIGYSEMGIFCW
jgi:hypothetical protein